MTSVFNVINEKGLPIFFQDGIHQTAFNPERIFQDFYIIGHETQEYNGKTASDLTNKALALIASHKQEQSINRKVVHQVISDLLILGGYLKAVLFLEERDSDTNPPKQTLKA